MFEWQPATVHVGDEPNKDRSSDSQMMESAYAA